MIFLALFEAETLHFATCVQNDTSVLNVYRSALMEKRRLENWFIL